MGIWLIFSVSGGAFAEPPTQNAGPTSQGHSSIVILNNCTRCPLSPIHREKARRTEDPSPCLSPEYGGEGKGLCAGELDWVALPKFLPQPLEIRIMFGIV
jgi:hypothetical protein